MKTFATGCFEPNHYYSYGLKIAAISSKKIADSYDGTIKNSNLYNDKELWDEADLNWYDYGFRNYDLQIGRFTQLDPLTDDYPVLTPYQYASCEPIANTDMDGLEAEVSNVAKSATDVTRMEVLDQVVHTSVKHLAKTLTKVAPAATTTVKTGSTLNSMTKVFLRILTQFATSATNTWNEIETRRKANLDRLKLESKQQGKAWGLVWVEDAFGFDSRNPLTIVAGPEEAFVEKTLVSESSNVYERVMSEKELKATQGNDGNVLLRGGRKGENFFSKEGTISNDAKRAHQRLGLDNELRTHKVKFTIEDSNVKIYGPRKAKPGRSGTRGGGMEYSTKQTTKIKIIKITKLKNTGK